MRDDSATFDFDRFLAIPRLSGLRASPDGSRLVVSVTTPAPERKSMRCAWWEIARDGTAPPRRLTRSMAGEGGSAFSRDGAFLFVSKRADPEVAESGDDRERGRLWRLDPHGGEARLIASMLGGFDEPRARDRPTGSSSRAMCSRAPISMRTRDVTRRGRTPASRRCCSRATRSGGGTTTSGRESGTCSCSTWPQNARLWYETVIAFLDEHVLGQEWRRPELVDPALLTTTGGPVAQANLALRFALEIRGIAALASLLLPESA